MPRTLPSLLTLMLLALLTIGVAGLTGCGGGGGGGDDDDKDKSKNKGNTGDDEGNSQPAPPPLVETYTDKLPELPGATAAMKEFRTLYNNCVKSVGGMLPKDYRDAKWIAIVMKDPQKWIAADEKLQAAKNTMNIGDYNPMVTRPIDNLNKVLAEVRKALIGAPGDGQTFPTMIAIDGGFRVLGTREDKDFKDADEYPILFKAMQKVSKGQYVEALKTYGFGPDFPAALVAENDRRIFESKTFPHFRGAVLYAILWHMLGGDIERAFNKGDMGEVYQLMSYDVFMADEKPLITEIKGLVTDTRVDGHQKILQCFERMTSIWDRKISKKYQELMSQVTTVISSQMSGGATPLTVAEVDDLERTAERVVAEISGWGIDRYSGEAKAFLKQWKENDFPGMRKKAGGN